MVLLVIPVLRKAELLLIEGERTLGIGDEEDIARVEVVHIASAITQAAAPISKVPSISVQLNWTEGFASTRGSHTRNANTTSCPASSIAARRGKIPRSTPT